MNKKVRAGIIILMLALVLCVLWNTVAYGVYNSILSPTVVANTSLGQMSGEDDIAMTAGRLAASNTIWNVVNGIWNLLCAGLVVLGGAKIVKGLKELADSIVEKKDEEGSK